MMRQVAAVYRFSLREMLRSWLLWLMGGILVAAAPTATALLRRSSLWAALDGARSAPRLSPGDRSSIVVGVVVVFVYAVTLMSGSVITTNVALERTSKVSILVFRLARPAVVVWGKLLAVATLVASAVLIVGAEVAVLAAAGMVPLGGILDAVGLGGIGVGPALVAGTCAALGVTLYTVLYAIVGLLVTDSAQLQFAQAPVTVVLIASFTAVFSTLASPSAVLARVLALVPFTSPFMEAGRVISQAATPVEQVSSFLLLMLAVAGATRAMSAMVRSRDPVGRAPRRSRRRTRAAGLRTLDRITSQSTDR